MIRLINRLLKSSSEKIFIKFSQPPVTACLVGINIILHFHTQCMAVYLT